MENPDGDQSRDDQPNEEPITRRRKGTTKLPNPSVRQGLVEKKHVDFDENMNPIGKERDKFMTFIGYKARSKVGILYPKWKLVSQQIKDMIWEDILVCNFLALVLFSFLIMFSLTNSTA